MRLLGLGSFSFVTFPLFALLLLLVSEPPIGRRAVVLDAINQECRRRDFEAREAARLLVRGGVGDLHPATNHAASEFSEQAANARLIDADPLKRLKERVIHNRILFACGAFCQRLAKVSSFIQNNDVAALSSLLKEVSRVGLSPSKRNDVTTEQLTKAAREVVLPLLERTLSRESESVDRQVIDVQKDSLGSPE